MYITYYGQSAFKLEVRNPQGEKVILALDPQSASEAGLKKPFFKADIVLSASPLNEKDVSVRPVGEELFFITQPGEYERNGIFVFGIGFEDTTLYRIEAEKMVFGHLGEIHKLPDNGQIENLAGIDILTIPVGGPTRVGLRHKVGENVLSSEKAAQLISMLEPRIVIPTCYKIPGVKITLDPLSKFLKEMGQEKEKVIDRLKISKKELPSEETEIIVLKNI